MACPENLLCTSDKFLTTLSFARGRPPARKTCGGLAASFWPHFVLPAVGYLPGKLAMHKRQVLTVCYLYSENLRRSSGKFLTTLRVTRDRLPAWRTCAFLAASAYYVFLYQKICGGLAASFWPHFVLPAVGYLSGEPAKLLLCFPCPENLRRPSSKFLTTLCFTRRRWPARKTCGEQEASFWPHSVLPAVGRQPGKLAEVLRQVFDHTSFCPR